MDVTGVWVEHICIAQNIEKELILFICSHPIEGTCAGTSSL